MHNEQQPGWAPMSEDDVQARLEARKAFDAANRRREFIIEQRLPKMKNNVRISSSFDIAFSGSNWLSDESWKAHDRLNARISSRLAAVEKKYGKDISARIKFELEARADPETDAAATNTGIAIFIVATVNYILPKAKSKK